MTLGRPPADEPPAGSPVDRSADWGVDPFGYPADVLGMDAETMRRLGHRVVDMVVDRHLRRNAEPAILAGDPDALRERLGGPLPEAPLDPDASLDLMASVALAHQQHGDHPRYFARVPGPSSFAGVLGDWMAAGFNAIASSWGGGSGPATVELVAIDWLRAMLGLPEGTEGVLVSGGSIGNLTGFAAARAAMGEGVAYLTDQSHASLARDLRQMGWPEALTRVLPSDDRLRMSDDALRAAMAADRAAGARPALVVATAGSTNTGAADPLDRIAEICAAEGAWMHVDGAYGGPAAMTEAGRVALKGIERADSLALDPHKWFFQPYDLGVCFTRRPGALERAFSMTPEYLRDVRGAEGEVNFGERGLELTRRARGLKLWMTIRTHGAAALREAVAQGIRNAEIAERLLRARPDLWEIVTPAQLGIVCFAIKAAGPGEHAARARAVSETGFACVGSTYLKGREVLRLCPINPMTTEDDLARTIEMLAAPTT